jgi:hypothetical protein
VPALEVSTRRAFAQASKGHCSPFANYAAVATAIEYEWSKGCLTFNASVIDYARRTKSLKVVILSGAYYRTLPTASVFAIRREANGGVVRAPLGLEATIAAQRETVTELRSLGLKVILVTPPPPSPFDRGQCWQRRAEGTILVGPYRGCTSPIDNPTRRSQQFDAMMTGFEQQARVPLIRLEAALCRTGSCQIEQNHKPLFNDADHFTEWGSQVVGRRLQLGERAWRNAR